MVRGGVSDMMLFQLSEVNEPCKGESSEVHVSASTEALKSEPHGVFGKV